jgi:hypothetical protein
LALANNSIELVELAAGGYEVVSRLEQAGHRWGAWGRRAEAEAELGRGKRLRCVPGVRCPPWSEARWCSVAGHGLCAGCICHTAAHLGTASSPQTSPRRTHPPTRPPAACRSDIRSLTLSPDDQLLLSASSSQLKVWNPRSGACTASMDSGYGLCALFAPGGRHAVLGTKEGGIEVGGRGGSRAGGGGEGRVQARRPVAAGWAGLDSAVPGPGPPGAGSRSHDHSRSKAWPGLLLPQPLGALDGAHRSERCALRHAPDAPPPLRRAGV